MKKLRKNQAALNLPTLTLEGGLFLPDQLEKAALGSAQWQTEADYGTPKGLKLKDDYSRAFQIACAQWKHFADQLERTDIDAVALTHTFVQELLRDVFGYSIQACHGIALGERCYPVSLLAGHVPVVIAPHTLALHEPDARFAIANSGARKKSAFMLTQELLNANPDHVWGIACNGKTLRLLRDAATLTRPSYLEIDLADLLGGARYAEFANIWRLLHASRARGEPTNCIWERWRTAGQEEGTRVREGLRVGVTDALLILGEGFLQHPTNDTLRNALHNGELSKDAYFQQLLRLIYRLIFLFSVEERGLLHPKDESKTAQVARRAYAEGYAVARLRELCLKRRARDRFDDHWQALRIVFKGLSEGEPRLALPALGGLFAHEQCPALDAARLDNAHLLAAMQNLRWASHKGVLAPVDYRNMGPEELGSVYESLLELVPEIDLPARKFGFVGQTSEGSTAGNARKLSGSYYTPDSLVQELIKSALDPVIEQRLSAQPQAPIEALLTIRVIDPACGSGHFLLAAARRLAEKLAQLRASDGEQTEQDFRHALREVVAKCIFGVDRNPMAIELARTALWLEGFEEGRPLGFLDHHLQVGDALLGLTDLKALELGIAKEAFKPISSDDKEVCKQLAKINAAALKDLEKKRNARAFGQLDVASATGSGLNQLQALEALPENTTQQTAAKEAAYRAFLEQAKTSRLAHAADLLVGAYLLPKLAATQADIPTTATLYLTLLADDLPAQQQGALAAAQAVCREARVLHWPLAFPQVFAGGGFDCVLGNPPWEIVQDRDGTLDESMHERQKKWFGGGIYSLLSGRRDLYKLFITIVPRLLTISGRCGFVLPIGFMFEDDCGDLRRELFDNGSVISVLHLQNSQKRFFPDVHASYRFLTFTFTREQITHHKFSTVIKSPAELGAISWCEISRDQFDLVIGKERSAVIFNNQEQAALHAKFVSKLIKLQNLDYRVVAEFHASSDKELLKTSRQSKDDWTLLKNGSFHHFSPRFGSTEKWVARRDVYERLRRKGLDPDIWINHPRLVFRDIARNDDTRTLIACLVPPGFSSTYDAPMIVPIKAEQQSVLALAFYAGYLTSFLADFIIRPFVDKHIKGYVLAHVPIPEFSLENPLMCRIAELSLSLVKESWLLRENGETPSVAIHHHPARITLEAMYLNLIGIEPDEARLLLSSFESVQTAEISKYKEYRTVKLILSEFDCMTLAKAQGESDVSQTNISPSHGGQGTYSAHGVVKDEVDARLLGLLLAMVQHRGRLSRRHLTDALALANQTTLLGTFADTQGVDIITGFQQRYPSIFDATRLAGDRIHAWLRHLESVGVIRLESQSDQLVTVSGSALPCYVLTDDETVRVAGVLTQAVEQASTTVASSDMPSTDASVKRA